MRCSNCGTENPEGLKFCNQCGTPLKARCANCGFDNAPGARFCGDCGVPLDSAVAPIRSEVQPHEGPTGERRHLTVLFCDLVGSTGIAAQLDPEEWRETVAGYHRAAAEAITRFGGHVAKYLGDGVMAFFGYPEAHDNDAEHASNETVAPLRQPVWLLRHSRQQMPNGPCLRRRWSSNPRLGNCILSKKRGCYVALIEDTFSEQGRSMAHGASLLPALGPSHPAPVRARWTVLLEG